MTKTIWSYQDNFNFYADLSEQESFYVPLEGVRGEYSRSKILTEYKLDAKGHLKLDAKPQAMSHVLFGGHVGSGKSTELRQLSRLLQKSYTVCELEIADILDINNLRFSDLVIAMAGGLVQKFIDHEVQPDPVFLKPVLEWFDTRIIKQEKFKDLEMEVKASVETGLSIPYLLKILSTMSAKTRTGATYREELRQEVRNGFTQLVQHFNALIAHANDLLHKQNQGPMLFIIDGTDKLKREDSKTFFDSDVNQLGQIASNLIVCAPIAVLLEEGATAQRFAWRERLPMVKIFERDESVRPEAVQAMVDMVLKRLPQQFFDSMDTVKYLVQMSGGHPRDLIRLVRNCFSRVRDDQHITRESAERSVRDISAEYQRNVLGNDWPDLVKIDQSKGEDIDRTEDRLRMLYDLVLLEYNNYWWRTHPLIRECAGYQRALKAANSIPV